MIDAKTGNVHLPNGFVITPALTLNDFRRSWFGKDARLYYPSSQGCWSRLADGQIDTYPLEVSLHFEAEKLTWVSLTVDWPDTVQEEQQYWIDSKAFNDALLKADFGEPDTFTDTHGMDAPGLGKAPNHLRPWSKAVSEFDYGGGDAYIFIKYTSDKAL